MVVTKVPYQSVKLSLSKVTRSNEAVEKLRDVAVRVSRIWTHTLQFLKAYYLHAYEMKREAMDVENPVPAVHETPMVITQKLVTNIMRTITIRDARGRAPAPEAAAQLGSLRTFYDEHYGGTIPNDEDPI